MLVVQGVGCACLPAGALNPWHWICKFCHWKALYGRQHSQSYFIVAILNTYKTRIFTICKNFNNKRESETLNFLGVSSYKQGLWSHPPVGFVWNTNTIFSPLPSLGRNHVLTWMKNDLIVRMDESSLKRHKRYVEYKSQSKSLPKISTSEIHQE